MQLPLLFLITLVILPVLLQACTNLLVSKGASKSGNNIIAYNADASNFYATVYHYPKAINIPAGTMRKVYSWDYGTYLGMNISAIVLFNCFYEIYNIVY